MKTENIYIAGPMCFYKNGYPQWYVMRDLARGKGFNVSLPNEVQLEMDPYDLRKNGDAIFGNCVNCMNASTAIICNLEFYRGADVDGGSIYEVGMAYAKGAHCYGYTRDKRPMVWKYQGGLLQKDGLFDRKGRPLPYSNLPFSPNIIGSMKIVEGDFDDCLQVFALDREEERKKSGGQIQNEPKRQEKTLPNVGKPVVYLAGQERYALDAEQKYAEMKAVCASVGFYAIAPQMRHPVFCQWFQTIHMCWHIISLIGSNNMSVIATSFWQILTISMDGNRTAILLLSAVWDSNLVGKSCMVIWMISGI